MRKYQSLFLPKFFKIAFCIFFILSIQNCKQSDLLSDSNEKNPAAESFDYPASDEIAIALADSVMIAMGGRDAYDKTTIIKWDFFDVRTHIWNKNTGDLRIIGLKDTFDISMNLNKMTGRVNYKNQELTAVDSLAKYLQKGKEMWINDAYWLLLPFKLKDSGVTLKYLGIDSTSAGQVNKTIELTFKEVGVTPENKYKIYIDTLNYQITQWDFYNNYNDEKPRFSTPWNNYKKYGEILLSSNRGEGYELTGIAVGDSLVHYFKEYK